MQIINLKQKNEYWAESKKDTRLERFFTYMANKLNISQAAYSKLEKNDKMNFSKLEQISSILEMDFMDILNFDESHVFNNYNQQGGNASSVSIQSFSDNERNQYIDRIKHLDNEVLFLRNQLESLLSK